MGATKLLILENSLGQKIRTFAVDSESLHLVYILESRRVEAVANLSALDKEGVEYQLLQKIKVSDLNKADVNVKGMGRVRLSTADGLKNSPIYELVEQNDENRLQVMLKKTTIAHVVAVLLLMVGSWAWTNFMIPKEEPQLVTIVLPEVKQVQEKPAKVPHVKMSEKKITPSKKIYKPVVKTELKTKAYKVNTTKAVDVKRVGALAALGGLPNGSKSAEGLDMKSLKNIRAAGIGSGGGGVGSAGRGGIKGYLPGSGLIGGAAGNGGQAQSAGGYGTRGVGGGKAGYGKIAMVGGTSAVSLPMDDEATVEGGLDRDQIIAVINRNMGQIVYCYEKGLQAKSDLGGRVPVDFVIGPNGRISKAKVVQSSLDSRMVETCIVDRMKTWQFPRPVGNVSVDVLYPFNLMRVSSRQ